MDPRHEKREAFKAAEDLLAKGDEAVLRFAALELRRCTEAVVYEKLWAYKDRIPREAARWQPPQALKALLQFEPDAASSTVISMAREEYPGGPTVEPFRVLGEDLRPKVGWLTKVWNKLGSFLHAQFPFSSPKPDLAEEAAYLREVLEELRPFVVRSFTSTLGTTVRVTCTLCDVESVANADGVRARGELFCLNSDCGARYQARFSGTEVELTLDAPYLECATCGKSFPLAPKRLVDRTIVKCPSCSAEHLIRQTWQYGLVPTAPEKSAAEDGPIEAGPDMSSC
jgi:DNA-directed RNA polymerase subunit RPC12/RpoP